MRQFVLFFIMLGLAVPASAELSEDAQFLSPAGLIAATQVAIATNGREEVRGVQTCSRSDERESFTRVAVIDGEREEIELKFDKGLTVKVTSAAFGGIYTINNIFDDDGDRMVNAYKGFAVGCRGSAAELRDATFLFGHYGWTRHEGTNNVLHGTALDKGAPYEQVRLQLSEQHGKIVPELLVGLNRRGKVVKQTVFLDYRRTTAGTVRPGMVQIIEGENDLTLTTFAFDWK